jgi:hypothetical protein
MGVKNWRGRASSRTENSGGQFWKKIRFTKVRNARRRSKRKRRRRRKRRRMRKRRERGRGGGEGG